MAEKENIRYLLSRVSVRREHMHKAVVEALKQYFPIESRKYRLAASNIHVQPKVFSSSEQKKAILYSRSLSEPVKADVTLYDAVTGDVLDEAKDFTLLHLPWMSPRHTFTVDGNEYSVANQPRVRPGVYTRTRSNEEIESAFNLAKGKNFRLSLQPDTGHFYMELSTTRIPLYNVLRMVGATEQDIMAAWGTELAANNSDKFNAKLNNDISKLHEKLVPRARKSISQEAKKGEINAYLADTKMDARVNRATLGKSLDHVNKDALLAASRKLLEVYRGTAKEDDRDSLEFKAMHTVEDHFAERIRLKGKDVASRVKFKMNFAKSKPTVRAFLTVGAFSKVLRSFITGASLSAQPTQINPIELLDYAVKVTPLGEGGIENDRAIPDEAREAHASQFGILDPIRTPETSHAGVDVRAAMLCARDDDGQMYTKIMRLRKGDIDFVSAHDMMSGVVAFPNQDIKFHKDCSSKELEREVKVLVKGELSTAKVKNVDYYISHPGRMYGPSTNLIPILDGIQGNRAIMGSKMMGQAVPLRDAEPPIVQSESYKSEEGTVISHEEDMARFTTIRATVDGTVSEVTEEYVEITDGDGNKVKEHIYNNYPLASKTYMHDTPIVKVGDKVKAGQRITESIYTRGGQLALGKNLDVAYLAYNGLNSNDAIVISESASNKLTSLHMHKLTIPLDKDTRLNKKLFRAHYPTAYSKDKLEKLDEDGVVLPKTKLEYGDPWVVALRETKPTAEDIMLGRLHKGLVRRYRDMSEVWPKDSPAEVVDVARTAKKVTISVKFESPMMIGDKLSNRYGGKGVVSKILPDDQMPQKENGEPIDVLVTSASVVSRINPAQIIETAIAKSLKPGERYVFKNFSPKNNIDLAREMLNKSGKSDKERVYDPVEKKWIDNVFVGPQYMLKLFKSTDTNFSARDIGGYDPHQQPGHGGEEGAKTLGGMEVNALLGHNARGLLREAAVIKSQRNSDFWRAVQLGLPLPPVKTTFAYDKFLAMLRGAGVNVERKGDKLVMAPLTDSDVIRFSKGRLRNAKMVRAKDLAPERGGLFDQVVTGGTSGEKWSHYDLPEPIINPMFMEPARRLLRLTGTELMRQYKSVGGADIKAQLNNLDLDKEKLEWEAQLKKSRGTRRNDAIKALKYISALQANSLKPGDAYLISKVPVLPPVMRPVTPSRTGDLMIDDPNYLYRDVFLAADSLEDSIEADLPDSEIEEARAHLYDSFSAMVGLSEPVSPQLKAKSVRGFIHNIAGSQPKQGYFQSKLVSRAQDFTGRGTAAPDPKLGLDEIGLPKSMAWKMYSTFILKRLVRSGYSATRAKELLDQKAPAATQALMSELKERPVLFNRAPTLWRFSVIAAYPRLVKGKTLKVNPFVEQGMNLDYDGDALQLHLPVTEKGVEDAKNMVLSKLVFSDKQRNSLLVFPQHEAIIGVFRATTAKPTGKRRVFKTKMEAWAAYKAGKLDLGDEVQVG